MASSLLGKFCAPYGEKHSLPYSEEIHIAANLEEIESSPAIYASVVYLICY
jgi:hypothetical protein